MLFLCTFDPASYMSNPAALFGMDCTSLDVAFTRWGTTLDSMVLFCCTFDPTSQKSNLVALFGMDQIFLNFVFYSFESCVLFDKEPPFYPVFCRHWTGA